MKLKRKESESYLEYILRVSEALKNKKITYKQWGNLLLGDDNAYGDDNCRKASYFLNKLLPKLEQDIISSEYSSDDMLENIEKAKDLLYKERVKYQDIMREKRKYLREESRFENLVEVMKEQMDLMPDLSISKSEIKLNNGVEAHLILSDFHYGLKIDNVLNLYNVDVSKQRLETLANKTIKYCEKHNVELLHITLGGDLINGSIHLGLRVEQEEDVITQIISCSEVLSNFLSLIQKHVPIKVRGVVGNHSRCQSNKHDSIKSENYERLIFKYVEQRLGLTIAQNGYEDFINFKIKNKDVVVAHGDKDNISNAKKHFCDVLNKVVDEIWLAHIHHFNIKDDNGTEIIVNGSVVGVDDYAMSLRCGSTNYQILRIYDDDISTYKLELN